MKYKVDQKVIILETGETGRINYIWYTSKYKPYSVVGVYQHVWFGRFDENQIKLYINNKIKRDPKTGKFVSPVISKKEKTQPPQKIEKILPESAYCNCASWIFEKTCAIKMSNGDIVCPVCSKLRYKNKIRGAL